MHPHTKKQYQKIIDDLEKEVKKAKHEAFVMERAAFFAEARKGVRAIVLILIGAVVGYLINQFI